MSDDAPKADERLVLTLKPETLAMVAATLAAVYFDLSEQFEFEDGPEVEPTPARPAPADPVADPRTAARQGRRATRGPARRPGR